MDLFQHWIGPILTLEWTCYNITVGLVIHWNGPRLTLEWAQCHSGVGRGVPQVRPKGGGQDLGIYPTEYHPSSLPPSPFFHILIFYNLYEPKVHQCLSAATFEHRRLTLTSLDIGPGDKPNSILMGCPNRAGQNEICNSPRYLER